MTGLELAERIPEAAVVVLVGASGSGKSTWAQAQYRQQEIVSSDDLRGVIGSGRHDLDATDDAFRLLHQIVAARTSRSLTTVIDTLGLDVDKRMSYLALARRAGMPAMAVVFDTPAELCRQRNASRDRPVPAPSTDQADQAGSRRRGGVSVRGLGSGGHGDVRTGRTGARPAGCRDRG